MGASLTRSSLFNWYFRAATAGPLHRGDVVDMVTDTSTYAVVLVERHRGRTPRPRMRMGSQL